MQPYPRSPDLIWPGHLHGTGCLSEQAMDTGVPTVVWRLCSGLGFAVTPPFLAGVLGGCAWVRVLVSPLHSLLGFFVCAVCLGFRLRPATPGCGVGVCVCLCACSACTPPLLAGVRGVGVCASARLSAAPRHSWLGCWGVCVCLCACSPCTPPLLAGVWVWVCVLGLRFRLRPASPGWGVWVCVCFCARSACTPSAPGWAVQRGCVCLG